MDISAQLMAMLATLGIGPVWLVPIIALVTLFLKNKLPNIKLPSLPSLPTPTPTPVPAPTPVLPNAPLIPDRPLLSLLLQLLMSVKGGKLSADEVVVAALVAKELVRASDDPVS